MPLKFYRLNFSLHKWKITRLRVQMCTRIHFHCSSLTFHCKFVCRKWKKKNNEAQHCVFFWDPLCSTGWLLSILCQHFIPPIVGILFPIRMLRLEFLCIFPYVYSPFAYFIHILLRNLCAPLFLWHAPIWLPSRLAHWLAGWLSSKGKLGSQRMEARRLVNEEKTCCIHIHGNIYIQLDISIFQKFL